MDNEALLGKIVTLAEPIVESLGLELIEREWVRGANRSLLRLYIDREGGPVSVEDCAKVSRALEGPLELAEVMPGPYVLEVSSPGEARPLRRLKDFDRFTGSCITLKTKYPLEGQQSFTGLLKGVAGETLCILTCEGEWKIPLTALRKARVKPTFEGGRNGKDKK